MGIHDLLKIAVDNHASDLHLRVGSVPTLRIYGGLTPISGFAPLAPRDVELYFEEITTPEQRKSFVTRHELDFEYSIRDYTRCRVNVMQQRSTLSIALRIIPYTIPSLAELNLPPVTGPGHEKVGDDTHHRGQGKRQIDHHRRDGRIP